MKRNFYIALIFIPVLLTSSCFMLRPLKIGGIQSIKIQNANLSSANLLIGIPVKNPNYFKVDVNEGEFEISVNSNKLGNAKLTKNFTISGHSDKVQQISVNLTYDNLFGGVFALAGGKELKVKCSGFANAKSLFFSKKIKVDVENNINLQQAFD
jgi:LEA14-like dessication related protein